MKKQLLIIWLNLFICVSIFGQDFIIPTKQWNVRLSAGMGFSTEIYIIAGDSVVESKLYNKIWVSYDSLVTLNYQGLLREEAKTVYYIPPGGSEGILYDFNLEVGATALVNNLFCSDISLNVIAIDTVEYFGVSRKRWHLGEGGDVYEYWLEGIGSLNGPLHTKYWECIVCPVWELLCLHEDDALRYIMPYASGCYQNTVGIAEKDQPNYFSVSPNPLTAGQALTLKTNTAASSLSILNSSGQLVKRVEKINELLIKIETDDFTPGMYFIQLTTTENKTQSKSLLIQ